MAGNFYQKFDQKLVWACPFFLALFPWVFVFSKHIQDFSYSVLLIPFLATVGFVAGLIFLLRFIFKNINKARLLVAFAAIGFLYYGFFYDFLFGLKVGGFLIGRHRYLYPFWGILFSCLGTFLLLTRRDLDKLSRTLKFMALVLIIIPLVIVTSYEFKNIGNSSTKTKVSSGDKATANINKNEVKEVPNIGNASNLPDIYYILPDQYARQDVLKEYFNYDSKEFIKFLEDRGFMVPDKNRSNYSITMHSVPSTLNMDYVPNFIPILPDEDSSDFDPLVEKIKNNAVKKFVESKGYRYIYLSSDAHVVGVKDTGDDIVESNLDNYMRASLKTTVLRPFGGRYSFKEKNINKWARNSVLNTFDQLSKIPTSNLKGPKFVFAHIMSPHGPYVFGRNGEETKLSFVHSPTYQEDMSAYLDQSIFTSKKISEVVDHILNSSKTPPIIIIQSDHGHYLDPHVVSNDLRGNIRTKNFSAFYLPGKNKNSLPRDINTVNTFRFIFNQYFGTNLKLLENKSYVYDGRYPYRFTEIVPDNKLVRKTTQ